MSDITEDSNPAEVLRQRIIHVFKIYPILTMSMVQVGIGMPTPARLWRPILDDLIASGVLKKETVNILSPLGRYQTYTRISLTQVNTVMDLPAPEAAPVEVATTGIN